MIEIIIGIAVICSTIIGATWKLSQHLTCSRGMAKQALDEVKEAKEDAVLVHEKLEKKIDKILERI